MRDFYANDTNCVERLYQEYTEHGKLIIAFDYDNTVFDYSGKKNSCDDVIEILQACKTLGFHLIVFTSCTEDRFPVIEQYLSDRKIPWDAINETPDFIPFKGRKVYYNILLDDRAGLSAALDILWRTIYTIRGYNSTNNIQDFG